VSEESIREWLAARAREFRASGATPAEPKLAATVLLLRSGAARPAGVTGFAGETRPAGVTGFARETRPADVTGPEVYLIRRAATMAFAAGMHAFPGGMVDPRDSAVLPGWAGPTPADWAARLNLPEPAARAVVSAAVREVFEESGVLLAGPDADTVVGDVSGPDWEKARLALIAREVGFAEFLAGQGLVLRSDLLTPWDRWLTPEFEPRRYDTYFFLARLPELQVTRDVGGEADRVLWGRPGDLTDLVMLPPTLVTLRALSGYPSVDAAMAADRDVTTAFQPTFPSN
jgi:8-oxo-dGTP pyrophosphatase MutT (NUDIX family)